MGRGTSVFRNKMKDPADNIIEELESLGVYRTYHMAPVAKKLGRKPFDKMCPGEEVISDVISNKELDDLAVALTKLGLDIMDIYDSGVVARRKLDFHGWEKHYRYHLHPTGVWKGGYSMRDTTGINEIVMINMNPDEFLTTVGWDINEDFDQLQKMQGKVFDWKNRIEN